MDLTSKKQVVKWQTSPVSVFKLLHCGLETFLESLCLVSVFRVWKMERLGLISVLRVQRLGLVSILRVWKMEHLGLVSVLWLNVLWTSYRFHQNRPSFIEDITKHFVSFFRTQCRCIFTQFSHLYKPHTSFPFLLLFKLQNPNLNPNPKLGFDGAKPEILGLKIVVRVWNP